MAITPGPCNHDQDFLRRLVGWIGTGPAAEIIEQEGFTPDSPRKPPYDCAVEKPLESGFSRLPPLYFDSAMSRLSSAGDRALTKLKPELNGKELFIVGFTDRVGSSVTNKILSEERALQVKTRLEQLGFKEARTMGCGISQRSEFIEADRILDRKVEIWTR